MQHVGSEEESPTAVDEGRQEVCSSQGLKRCQRRLEPTEVAREGVETEKQRS